MNRIGAAVPQTTRSGGREETGGRELVFGFRFSVKSCGNAVPGSPVGCWRFCSSGFPARAHCWRFGICGRWLSRVLCPLTPDPSPPFHGGEGRILWSVSRRGEGSREAAKTRRETPGSGRNLTGGIQGAHPGTAVSGSPVGCWRFCSSGFPARAHHCAIRTPDGRGNELSETLRAVSRADAREFARCGRLRTTSVSHTRYCRTRFASWRRTAGRRAKSLEAQKICRAGGGADSGFPIDFPASGRRCCRRTDSDHERQYCRYFSAFCCQACV